MLSILRGIELARAYLGVALCIGAPVCSADTPGTALAKLPGVAWDVRFGEPGRTTDPQVLAVSPSMNSLWVAGISLYQRDSQPWLKKLDKNGSVSGSVALGQFLQVDGEWSLSSLQFTDALAQSDESLVLAAVVNAEVSILIGVNGAGTFKYRTEVFGGEAGYIGTLQPWEQDRIVALGYKRIDESLHAALVELDTAGAVVRERVIRDRKATQFSYALASAAGELIFIGQAFDFGDGIGKLWIARVNDSDEILEERLLPGTVEAVAAGEDGGFAVCLAFQSEEGLEAQVAEFDRNLKELWRSAVYRSKRGEALFSCRLARVKQGGYVVTGQSFDPGPSVAAVRLDRGGAIAWKFVEPTSETSYTWHLKPFDLVSRGDSYFMLTELLLPPQGGWPSSLAGVVHFRITR